MRTLRSGDFPEVIRLLDPASERTSSRCSLFRDEQRRILDKILATTLEDTEAVLRQSYSRNLPLMRFLDDLATPLPGVLHAIAGFVINSEMARAAQAEDLDRARIGQLLEDAAREKVTLDAPTLEFAFRRRLEAFARRLANEPEDPSALAELEAAVEFPDRLPFRLRLWDVQNIVYELVRLVFPGALERARRGQRRRPALGSRRFSRVAELLEVTVPSDGG